MKSLFGILGVASVAIATSVGFAHLQAATNPLLDYCPATTASDAGSCEVAANMLLSVGKPSDASLVASINAIAAQVQSGPTHGAACADAAAGIKVLAAAIGNAATRSMAEALGAALCGGGFGALGGGSGAAADVSVNSLALPVSPGGCRRTSGSSGSSGQSSSSSGSSGEYSC
jgi:hypothetical protein